MPTQTMSTREAVAEGNDAFMHAFARGDAAQLAALYTPTGQVFPPGGDVAIGRQAIQAFWQAVMDTGITDAKLATVFETVELEQYNDTAIEVGRYTLNGAGGQIVDTGKYVVIWKESAGRWHIHRDIWNSSRAEPTH